MAYSEYINTQQIESYDLRQYTLNYRYIEPGLPESFGCQEHGVVLLEQDHTTGNLKFGCENCGYREEWILDG